MDRCDDQEDSDRTECSVADVSHSVIRSVASVVLPSSSPSTSSSSVPSLRWVHLAVWASSLLLLRVLLFSILFPPAALSAASSSTPTTDPRLGESSTGLAQLHDKLSLVERHIDAITQMTQTTTATTAEGSALTSRSKDGMWTLHAAVQQCDSLEHRCAEIETKLTTQPSSSSSSASQTKKGNEDPQQDHRVYPGPDTYFAPTRSGVPPLTATEQDETSVFCDELRNTFPLGFFGGSVTTEVADGWCRSGSLGRLTSIEHRPHGVEESEIIPFTVMQVHRHAYLMAQFQDRVIRYREAMQPLIESVEARGDRMLGNYI